MELTQKAARIKNIATIVVKNGKLIEPGATMEQLIEKSVEAMRQMKMPETLIEQTKKFIPMLNRWKVY